jgi:hypothetical protein
MPSPRAPIFIRASHALSTAGGASESGSNLPMDRFHLVSISLNNGHMPQIGENHMIGFECLPLP